MLFISISILELHQVRPSLSPGHLLHVIAGTHRILTAEHLQNAVEQLDAVLLLLELVLQVVLFQQLLQLLGDDGQQDVPAFWKEGGSEALELPRFLVSVLSDL